MNGYDLMMGACKVVFWTGFILLVIGGGYYGYLDLVDKDTPPVLALGLVLLFGGLFVKAIIAIATEL